MSTFWVCVPVLLPYAIYVGRDSPVCFLEFQSDVNINCFSLSSKCRYSLSALSFPGMPIWLGIQTSTTWLLMPCNRIMSSTKRLGRLWHCPALNKAMVLSESVKTANLIHVVFSNSWILSKALLMAVISAAKIVTPSVMRAASSISSVTEFDWI